ncbi:MAG: glycoside hydrolase family 28 protein, partial [Clostridia bacterium]|nr:glycoside hydrolase family 28 protein [Clostridia bacterium]
MIYNIKDFGAIGDGKTLNTNTIQKAIDECSKNGGGRVLIDDGVFLTGGIEIKSNVDLHVTAGTTLLGSPNVDDFPNRENVKHVNTEMLPRWRNSAIIFADEAKNISLTGMGTIDCNGLNFVKLKEEYKGGWRYERINAPTPPRVVFFTGCKNVKIEDITMVNQPSGWSYWIHDCDYVTFDKLKINADVQYPNNDGIHINSSRN